MSGKKSIKNTLIDILSIDADIRKKYEKHYKELPKYKERLKELQETLKNNNISHRNIGEIKKNISTLEQTIKDIENRTSLSFYISETAKLIQQYKKILKTPMKVSFIGKPRVDNREKKKVINQYLRIAQKYHELNVKIPTQKYKITCDNCPNKTDFIYDENVCICPECGSQQEVLQHTSSYKDIDRVNISTKYTYDRKVHFRDCINQYQGKQNCTIDKKVYDDLEDILDRHHLLQGKKGDKKEYRMANITKEHILMFLRELGYSKHYENVTLIHYNMTGKKPDDISHLEDRLLNDFDLLLETYDKHFKHKIDRVNFISTQYVLYQLLRRHKHACKKEDFVILKTIERKSFHDDITRELFTYLGWNYTPTM